MASPRAEESRRWADVDRHGQVYAERVITLSRTVDINPFGLVINRAVWTPLGPRSDRRDGPDFSAGLRISA